MDLHLTARPPFSFAAVADSHGWRQLAPFRGDRDELSYVIRLATGRVIELRLVGTPGGARVTAEDSLDPAEETEVAATVTWMLGLDQDLSAFYEAARGEPKLARAAAGAKGRILRSPTLFEDVVKTILTTNTVWGSTKRMVANVVTLFGDPLPADPARRAFPTPAQLAATDEATLRSVARLGYRAPYVLDLARRIRRGRAGSGDAENGRSAHAGAAQTAACA